MDGMKVPKDFVTEIDERDKGYVVPTSSIASHGSPVSVAHRPRLLLAARPMSGCLGIHGSFV